LIYLDTGCLLKLYFVEPESDRVAKLIGHNVIRFTGLHDLELRNALELKLFRKEASSSQMKATVKLIEDDLSAGVLHRSSLDWEELLKLSSSLAADYSAKLGCRSLDILHCASAVLLHEPTFITTDERQRGLAQKIGLLCPKL
jgi:hypothetical protein